MRNTSRTKLTPPQVAAEWGVKASTKGRNKAVLVPYDTIKPQEIEWLWPSRIAQGKLSLLVGDPARGKTSLALDMAARVSIGEAFPDGKPCGRGGVIFATVEDGAGDTIRPRLDLLGANVSRILHFEGAKIAADVRHARKPRHGSGHIWPMGRRKPSRACPEAPQSRLASRTVAIGTESFPYFICSGKRLSGPIIAFDTETTLIQNLEVPQLVLASASDGDAHCVIEAAQVRPFLHLHKDCDFVAHNAQFDFWVVDKHLRKSEDLESLAVWWDIVDAGRLHDTMLLDMLVELAKSDAYPVPRDLGQVANNYAHLPVDKADPYLLRYSEILDKDWDCIDPGFLAYAVKDAIVTHRAWQYPQDRCREEIQGIRNAIQPAMGQLRLEDAFRAVPEFNHEGIAGGTEGKRAAVPAVVLVTGDDTHRATAGPGRILPESQQPVSGFGGRWRKVGFLESCSFGSFEAFAAAFIGWPSTGSVGASSPIGCAPRRWPGHAMPGCFLGWPGKCPTPVSPTRCRRSCGDHPRRSRPPPPPAAG